MKLSESISYLAWANSKSCYPRREEEINKKLPYFQISKDDYGLFRFTGYNYENHDNASRMPYLEYYLTNNVFPYIEEEITGYYNIQLHDSYTYLNDDINYKNVLTFSKFIDDKNPILIPDPFMLANWNHTLDKINDQKIWEHKKNKIIFCGTTTGNRNVKYNDRINLCLWGQNYDFCDFYITKIAQMKKNDCEYLNQNIFHDPIPITEQLNYKYHLIMDGNTCRFDIWPFKTHSVLFKYKSNEMLWYYPLLQENIHYISVDKTNIENRFNFINSNPQRAIYLISNAHYLADHLFRPIMCQSYFVQLFENIGNNK